MEMGEPHPSGVIPRTFPKSYSPHREAIRSFVVQERGVI
jgi:hypothetical protein